ncbi:KDGP aldolase [Pullulanibacillus sp. KACC 23026]|uniref:KDGP aldolase n=1 Tax=Pullulanibacillus sp. KACC 23026 TaxID=3028315 RepID=UPI0023B0CE25|nr:KDGP aldolase [Pullulanibacillus sp. KACC 23026]WEG11211.1 KDGP aldolase [Pullulanibacillus sp. KACC 23026]
MIRLNVLAKNFENAKQINDITEGNVLIGVMVKDFTTDEEAVEIVNTYQEAGIAVSVGLGNGDASQWERVIRVSVETRPAHVNQVFPAAGYTLGALKQANSPHTLVNALIRPSGEAGKVIISTGAKSEKDYGVVTTDVAAAMLADIGVPSIKFFPIKGNYCLDEVAAMVQSGAKYGLDVFEPTGGIDTNTIGDVVEVCLQNGAKEVIPHVYTSIVDPVTGHTKLEDVKELLRKLPSVTI